jgi:hypothetical protein
MSSGGQRQVLLKTSLEKSQAKLVKKLDQATFINSLPKVIIKTFKNPTQFLFSLFFFREKSIN